MYSATQTAALPRANVRAGTIVTALPVLFLLFALLTHTLFPVYVAILVWSGLALREPRLRQLLPSRT